MSKKGDPRLGELLLQSLKETSVIKTKIAILGYPCDIGVLRNNGRVGAKDGPAVIRQKLPKLGPLSNPEWNIDLKDLHLVDRGDVLIRESLEDNHIELTKAVQSIITEGYIGIIVGGGNDQSYCNAKGLMNATSTGDIGVVNIDAHFDVRPLIDGKLAHSGSPFRQLLLDPEFKGLFYEFASQGNQCSTAHAQFIKENNGRIKWLSELRVNTTVKNEFQKMLKSFEQRDVFVSFDIDSIQGADCPGVSCPAVIGLTSQEALDICFLAGKHENVRLLDFSEYNPVIEEDRTARLVVNMIYYFLMGVASRKNTIENGNLKMGQVQNGSLKAATLTNEKLSNGHSVN